MQTNSAPTARHSAAAQPTKLISALVGAFILLQISTFLCKNAGHITEHNNRDQSRNRPRTVALNPLLGPAQCLPLQQQQQQRPQPQHRQQQQQHPQIGSSIAALLAMALLHCSNVTTVDGLAAPSTEQLMQRGIASVGQQRPDQMQRQSRAQTVNFGALVKTTSTSR